MRKNVFLCFLSLGLLCSGVTKATESVLQLFPDEEPTKVKLPFPYKHIADEERKDLKFIPERFYTVLTNESSIKAFVGPLSPCIFVGLRNAENGITAVFHKHYSNDVKSLIQIAQKELKVQDPKNLQGLVFTNNMAIYDQQTPGFFGLQSMKARHGGKTQIEELKFIKDSLIQAFKIEDRTQIKAQKYTSTFGDYELGEYEFAEQSVLVDANLNVHSVCAMHERFPGHFSDLPFHQRLARTMQHVQGLSQELIVKHFEGKITDEQLNTYNVIHFEKL